MCGYLRGSSRYKLIQIVLTTSRYFVYNVKEQDLWLAHRKLVLFLAILVERALGSIVDMAGYMVLF